MSQGPGTGGPMGEATVAGAARPAACRPPQAVFEWCPLCSAGLVPEHAHYRCPSCGWRDSCCD
jgi:hypothetical protein